MVICVAGPIAAGKTVSVAEGTSVSERLLVALPCVSMSMISTRLPRRVSSPARLMAEVVLPVPPFWFVLNISATLRRLASV